MDYNDSWVWFGDQAEKDDKGVGFEKANKRI